MSCPYGTADIGSKTMKGCTLTESKVEISRYNIKKSYLECPSCCRDGDYKKCPIYRERGGREDE